MEREPKITLAKVKLVNRDDISENPFRYCVIYSLKDNDKLQRGIWDPQNLCIDDTNLENLSQSDSCGYFEYVTDNEQKEEIFMIYICDNEILSSSSNTGKRLEDVLEPTSKKILKKS